MANPKIKVKRSSVEGKVPAVSQLERGELAVNSYDGKVYILKDQFSVGIATTTHTINPWNEPNGVGAGVSYGGDIKVLGISTFSGITNVTGEVNIGDSATGSSSNRLRIGDDADIQIYRDSSTTNNHLIAQNGLFYISNDNLRFTAANTSKPIIQGNVDADVKLYYAANEKLATRPSGVDVTGGLKVSGITTVAFVDATQLKVSGVTTMTGMLRLDSGNLQIYGTAPNIFLRDTNDEPDYRVMNSHGSFKIFDEDNGVDRFTINPHGKVSVLYDLDVDGHTDLDNVNISGVSTFSSNVKFDGSLGVGIANPSQKIHIDGGNLLISNSTQSGSSAPQIRLNSSSSDGSLTRFMLGLATGDNHFINGAASNDSCIAAPSNILFGVGSTRKFRIKTTDVLTDVDLIPSGDNQTSLGRSNARWSDLFTVDAAFSGNVRVDGISTFRSSSIFEGSITCGDDSAITGGAPTDQGNLAVYGIGKNSVIIQATNNGSDRGIAWRNTGDAYAAYLNAQNAGNNTVDLVFGVAASSGPHTSVNDCPERLRISNDGNIGVNQSSPSAKLDVNGTLNVDGTATLDALTVGNYDFPTVAGSEGLVLKVASDGNLEFGSGASGGVVPTEKTFTASQGQTVFTDTTDLPTYIQVFVNGIKIRPTSDFSKSGASVTLVTAATAGDEIDLVRFD